MFLVSDGCRASRRKLIDCAAGADMVIRTILAAIDFEWTLRRVVLALGCTATKVLGVKFDDPKFRKIDGLKKLWKEEVCANPNVKAPTLVELINHQMVPSYETKKRPWDCWNDAWSFRNRLVHGLQGSSGEKYGRNHSETLLRATDVLVDFALKNKKDVFKPIRRVKVITSKK